MLPHESQPESGGFSIGGKSASELSSANGRYEFRELPRNPTIVGEPMLNALSVDVEDYFQVGAFEDRIDRSSWDTRPLRVADNTRRMLELFAKHDALGTFFFVGWIAEKCPGLVREVQDAGHEVGVHTYDHRRLTTMTPDGFRNDLVRTKHILEDQSGAPVIGFRAPNFSLTVDTLWAFDILVEEGFVYDSSVRELFSKDWRFPRFPFVVRPPVGGALLEFPLTTLKVGKRKIPFLGGNYLRQLPETVGARGIERHLRDEGRPVVLYTHPWEIDPEQPRIQADLLTRMRHYRNLDKTYDRLESLLKQFHFGTMKQVLGIA